MSLNSQPTCLAASLFAIHSSRFKCSFNLVVLFKALPRTLCKVSGMGRAYADLGTKGMTSVQTQHVRGSSVVIASLAGIV
jgi:hypothetical protein